MGDIARQRGRYPGSVESGAAAMVLLLIWFIFMPFWLNLVCWKADLTDVCVVREENTSLIQQNQSPLFQLLTFIVCVHSHISCLGWHIFFSNFKLHKSSTPYSFWWNIFAYGTESLTEWQQRLPTPKTTDNPFGIIWMMTYQRLYQRRTKYTYGTSTKSLLTSIISCHSCMHSKIDMARLVQYMPTKLGVFIHLYPLCISHSYLVLCRPILITLLRQYHVCGGPISAIPTILGGSKLRC